MIYFNEQLSILRSVSRKRGGKKNQQAKIRAARVSNFVK